MSFLGAVVAAAITCPGLLSKLERIIDRANNPDKFYKDTDVNIINEARRLFKEEFPEQTTLPTELLFLHELAGENKEDAAAKVTEYQPPGILPNEYSRDRYRFGNNVIAGQCKTAVTEIIIYLNALNIKEKGFIGFVAGVEGHKNDATRFICNLLIHAFVQLSIVDLRVPEALEEPCKYIQFLTKLQFSKYLVSPEKGVRDSVRDSFFNPDSMMQVLNGANKRLKQIVKLIKLAKTQCGIKDHFDVLAALLHNHAWNSFVFANLIISNTPVSEAITLELVEETQSATRIRKQLQDYSPFNDKQTALQQHTIALAKALQASDPFLGTSIEKEDKAVITMSATQTELFSVATSSNVFDFDKDTKEWIGIKDVSLFEEKTGGVYSSFQQYEFIQEYLKFCALLQKCGESRACINQGIGIALMGGNALALWVMGEHVTALIEMVQKLINLQKICFKTIFEKASKKWSAITDTHKQEWSEEDKLWVANFSLLQRLLPDTKMEESFKRINDVILDIQRAATEWQAFPKEKLQKMVEGCALFMLGVDSLGRSISGYKDIGYVHQPERLHDPRAYGKLLQIVYANASRAGAKEVQATLGPLFQSKSPQALEYRSTKKEVSDSATPSSTRLPPGSDISTTEIAKRIKHEISSFLAPPLVLNKGSDNLVTRVIFLTGGKKDKGFSSSKGLMSYENIWNKDGFANDPQLLKNQTLIRQFKQGIHFCRHVKEVAALDDFVMCRRTVSSLEEKLYQAIPDADAQRLMLLSGALHLLESNDEKAIQKLRNWFICIRGAFTGLLFDLGQDLIELIDWIDTFPGFGYGSLAKTHSPQSLSKTADKGGGEHKVEAPSAPAAAPHAKEPDAKESGGKESIAKESKSTPLPAAKKINAEFFPLHHAIAIASPDAVRNALKMKVDIWKEEIYLSPIFDLASDIEDEKIQGEINEILREACKKKFLDTIVDNFQQSLKAKMGGNLTPFVQRLSNYVVRSKKLNDIYLDLEANFKRLKFFATEIGKQLANERGFYEKEKLITSDEHYANRVDVIAIETYKQQAEQEMQATRKQELEEQEATLLRNVDARSKLRSDSGKEGKDMKRSAPLKLQNS